MLHFLLDLLALGSINAIMVTGLNIQYGYSGLLNFAFYTYVALGAYIAGVTTMGKAPIGETYILQWHLPWYMGILLGAIAAAALGALVFSFTVRRLRSDYLAIVTVAAAYIFYNIVNSAQGIFDGANGLYNVPYIANGANLSITQYSGLVFIVALVLLVLFIGVSRRLFRSPLGRILRGIREDEVIVTTFGRSLWQPLLVVYVLGCFMGGAAGGLFIFYINAWSPAAFLPLESFFLLAALVIGGSGSYWGALLGAFGVIEGLSELIRYVPALGNFADAGAIRLILIGLGLILVLRFRPEGLLPERWLQWYAEPGRGMALKGRLRGRVRREGSIYD